MKVLVVDDDHANRTILQAYLEKLDAGVHLAADGQEAVDAFTRALDEQEPFDLICMDIMMPGMNGQEALQRIRQIETERGVAPGQEAKALMITCLGDQKNVCQAFFHGHATHYLTKPVSKEAFFEAIQCIKA